MIDELYFSGTGKLVRTNAELIQLVHRWMVWDSFRLILIDDRILGVGAGD